MKTKIPKCVKCNKPMRAMYTKRTYKYNDKYKTFWSKEGYICNHLYYPIVKITYYQEQTDNKVFANYLVGVYDIEIQNIFKALDKIFRFYHFFFFI